LAGWYSAALSAQASSGLSITEYAPCIGVAAATLYEWRQRLSVLAADEAGASPPSNLVEVTIARPMKSSRAGGLIVRVGDAGRSIEVPSGFDAEDLRRLMAVLESC
jgi:transposase-like protein